MEPDDQPTCGQGLAANADLPAKLAEMTAAMADVLERHTDALDTTDPAAQEEFEAYSAVVRAQRRIAGDLAGLAEQMTEYRDLPMGQHDEAVMTDPEGQTEAFERLVAIERELLELLSAKVEQGEQLLG